MTMTEALKRAQKKYQTERVVDLHVRLNIETDADIIDHLSVKQSKGGYIKDLIRQDIKRTGTQ